MVIGTRRAFEKRTNARAITSEESNVGTCSLWKRLKILQVIQGQTFPWSAFITNCGAWAPDQHCAHRDKEAGTNGFVSVVSLRDGRAREEWYSDYAKRSRTQYDGSYH
ncbi:hypothetical protein PCH_Pc20g05290 [Penicillium rubens Wisconsin 54-1255]|uniref:Uncharacterized protein n=1 Tax=Penicillium rubens (strain ATCC 28089 / DSM 1075 / NRRL 1951 / Wisconsin 54-1255) TaxID=500485 RepID=B6HET9_PENRW|nr:hypothetical protein PCH_Pc20g05290 [Penicillium rubens Wisconsin 54-1255]